jgi:hypothetical protein
MTDLPGFKNLAGLNRAESVAQPVQGACVEVYSKVAQVAQVVLAWKTQEEVV